MTADSPLVSVIVPTKDRDELLDRALASVLAQSLTDLECIVIDDAPSRGTEETVRAARDERISYVTSVSRHGASAARNVGIRHARASLIAFLDDDDEWLPTKLEKQVQLIRSLPDTFGLVYCWMDYVDTDGHVAFQHHPTLRGDVFGQVLATQAIGGCPTLLVRRQVIDHVGAFDELLPRGNDGDFIRRVCRLYEVELVAETLVRVYAGHGRGRISAMDYEGVQNAIKGEMAKLEKFSDVLDDYPRQTSIIHAKIGRHYAALGDWHRAFAYFFTGIKIYPLGLGTYRQIAGTLKDVASSRNPGEAGSVADE